jgi:hypothetical protein
MVSSVFADIHFAKIFVNYLNHKQYLKMRISLIFYGSVHRPPAIWARCYTAFDFLRGASFVGTWLQLSIAPNKGMLSSSRWSIFTFHQNHGWVEHTTDKVWFSVVFWRHFWYRLTTRTQSMMWSCSLLKFCWSDVSYFQNRCMLFVNNYLFDDNEIIQLSKS